VIDPAKLRAIVESEREVSFWGKTYRITPRVIEEVLGDGGQLIWLQPLNTRPNFYVLQVDSTWTLSNWGQPGTDGLLSDHLEEIHDAINDQFGCCICGEESEYPEGERYECRWPVLHDDCGVSWGAYRIATETAKGGAPAQNPP
jgi:hypothetical protein